MEESSIITLIGAIGYSHEVCFYETAQFFGLASCMRTFHMRTPLIVSCGSASFVTNVKV
jgi:hypothetical protein